MAKSLATWATILSVLTCPNAVASASDSVDFFEVVAVAPSPVIKHDVRLKGPFDDEVIRTFVSGPQLFCHAVGFGDKTVRNQNACLNWYEITKPAEEPRRILSVRDALRGSGVYEIAIENAVFLLSPAQRVLSGPPSELSNDLSCFKAYRIVNGPQVNREVKLTGAFGTEDHIAAKAAFLCVPAEQWHHHERFAVKNAKQCLLVYELASRKDSVDITTIDQFGMNKLKVSSGRLLCVPAQIVKRSRGE